MLKCDTKNFILLLKKHKTISRKQILLSFPSRVCDGLWKTIEVERVKRRKGKERWGMGEKRKEEETSFRQLPIKKK